VSNHFLVAGGTVFDGAAREPALTDVRIEDGTITEIGPQLPREGARLIDAAGAWVTPGFVDAHSHCDLAALSGNEMEGRARAGVTAEIVGQDGLGYAPASGAAAEAMASVLAPITGEAAPAEWPSVDSYLEAVDAGAFARVATLIPHGALRAAVVGGVGREASAAECQAMAKAVSAEMAHGAVGVSTGLSYPPALWSDTDELVEVTAALPPGRGRYVTHLRDYGHGFDASLAEAFDIGRRSARPVHLSHFHVSGPGRGGQAQAYLQKVEAARAEGVEVTCDSYPYTIACTFLTTVLPRELQELGGHALAQHLQSHERATAVSDRMDSQGPGPTVAAGWDNVFLSGLDGTTLARWDGRSVASIATSERSRPGQVVIEVVRALEGKACILVAQGHRDNVLAIAADDRQVVGSDGIPGSGVPHPRATGSFLRFLRWARDGVVDVAVGEMVARMTARTAGLFGLPVGHIRVGGPADILVIDPAALSDGPDTGSYTPDAVRYSFLDGEPAIDDGRWMAPRLRGLALRAGQRR
jgi:N-acyl-D-amino-acid deacylase